MSETNTNTPAQQPTGGERPRNKTVKPVPPLDWRWILTVILGTGIGVRIARSTASAIWPGREDFWGALAATAALAALASGLVALVVGKLLRLGNKR